MKNILPLHTIENPFLVKDYPYGFRLRCEKRYWIETSKTHGVRLVTQTSDPKRGGWNKPKAGTYAEISAALYTDENGHVQLEKLSQYSDAKESRAFLETYGENAANLKRLRYWVDAKERFEVEKAERGNPDYGTQAYKEAYQAAVKWALNNEKNPATIAQ